MNEPLPRPHYRPMHPAVSSFLYVVTCFALFALFPLFGYLGYFLADQSGAIVGVGVAFFILVWAACWGSSN